MTRLRMLMTEREAFFGGNPEQNNNNNISSHSSGGPHSDFDGPPFEDLQASRYAARSTDSFDSYDYPAVGLDARRGGGGGLQASHAQSPLVGGLSAPHSQQQSKSLYAPPSQQHQLYEYGSNPGSAGSSSKLSQSSSVGGLGLGLSTSQRSGLSDLSSPLGGPLSSPSYGSSLRPNVGGSRSQVSLGLGLAGSSVVGRRAVGAPLAPVDRLQGQGQGLHGGFNGIERGLMLNAQLTGHAHHGHSHGLGLGLSGSGIDRVEQSLNGTLHGLGSASYHDDQLPPAFGHHGLSASNSARLTSGTGTGLSPTTHSSRSSSNSYMSNNNNNNNNNNQSGNNSFLYGSNNSSGRDVSLSALLGESNNGHSHSNNHNNNNNNHSGYSQFGADPHTPLDLDLDLTERDTRDLSGNLTNLYDLLSDPLGTRQSNAATNTHNILSTLNSMNGHNTTSLHTSSNSATATISALRLDVTPSPQKVVLGPLSGVSPSPSSTSNTSSNTPSHHSGSSGVPSVDHRVSPRVLAPLQESPTSSTSSHKELRERERDGEPRERELPHTYSAKDLPLQGPGVRKLSLVGKAATYNDAVSSGGGASGKDKRGVVVLPELETSPTKLPPTAARSAFTEHTSSSSNNNSNNNTSSYNSDLALGIASPENSSSESRGSRHGANLNFGSASPTPGSASNKRFPLIKASTTSRIPSEISPGTKSPSHKMLFKGSNNNNKNYDYTPPGSALDRAASDSTNMNFLASEMAEMVLDTPHKPGFGPTHSRDNSSDLSRLLAAINNSGSDVGDNSLPSVTSKSFKRIPSISSFLGFD